MMMVTPSGATSGPHAAAATGKPEATLGIPFSNLPSRSGGLSSPEHRVGLKGILKVVREGRIPYGYDYYGISPSGDT